MTTAVRLVEFSNSKGGSVESDGKQEEAKSVLKRERLLGELAAQTRANFILTSRGVYCHSPIQDLVGEHFSVTVEPQQQLSGELVFEHVERTESSFDHLFQRLDGTWWVSRVSKSAPGHVAAESYAVPRQDAASDRELQICWLLGCGWSVKEIGQRLWLSPLTVHRHIARLREKYDWPDTATFRAVCGWYRPALSILISAREIEVPNQECLLCRRRCFGTRCDH